MATRFDKLMRGLVIAKSNSIDAVFLKNQSLELGGDDVMREPYKKSDLVFICISTTARAISQIPLIVTEKKKRMGVEEWLPVSSDNPKQRLFDRPNIHIDKYSFTESIVDYLLLDGQVFVLPIPMKSETPDALWVIRKKYIKPARDSRGNLVGWYYTSTGMLDTSNFGDMIIPVGSVPLGLDEMARIYFFNPYNTLDGFAPLEAARLNITVDYKSQVYTSKFFDEGAQPGGTLETDKRLGTKQFDRTIAQFESKHGGYQKGHRIALLEDGLKFHSTGMSQKDMEFQKLRKLTARRIYQCFGMKESVVSETEQINYATSREERKEWWEGTNLPIMSLITSSLNFVLFEKGGKFQCKFDITAIDALREVLKDRTETGYKLWQIGFTANEVNQRLGLGFVNKPWRDKWYMPVNLVPADEAGKAPSNPPPPEPPLEEPKEEISLLKEELEDNLFGSDLQERQAEAQWKRMIASTLPLEELFEKKVSKVFFNMRKRTLELFHKQKDISDIENDPYSSEGAMLETSSSPLYEQALLLGVTELASELGISISFNLIDPEAILFLANKRLKIRGILNTIKEQIRAELLEGLKNAENMDQLAARIRNVFNVASSRIKTIARTEIVGAHNEGTFIAINRSGFKKMQWFTARDEKVRPTHQVMHGKVIEVGKLWTLPGGVRLRHPGDAEGPARETINCRCINVVVPGSHYLD